MGSSRETWNRYAFYFNAEEGTVFPHDTREMDFYRKLRGTHSGSCLELGAGAGRLARALFQEGMTCALEPSDSMISSWSRSAAALALRVQAAGERIPFRDRSFQFVCFPYNGLQCVLQRDGREAVVREAFRVTAPEGVFVLEISPVFGRRSLEPLTERYCAELGDGRKLMLRERVDRSDESGNIKYHMFYTLIDGKKETVEEVVLELAPVTLTEIRQLLENAGFRDLTVWGDYDRSPYDEEMSPRLLIMAEKGC